MIERNRSFRFMSLTSEQWEEVERRRADPQGTWSWVMADRLRFKGDGGEVVE